MATSLHCLGCEISTEHCKNNRILKNAEGVFFIWKYITVDLLNISPEGIQSVAFAGGKCVENALVRMCKHIKNAQM